MLLSGVPSEQVAADGDAAVDGAVGADGNGAAAGAVVEGECCVLGNTKGAQKAGKNSADGLISFSEKSSA